RPKVMAVEVDGELPVGSTAKDLILALIAQETTGGAQGYMVEYRGETIRGFSMEERMTICNMSIEWGAKVGLISPDETTVNYLKDRQHTPPHARLERAVEYWKTLTTDNDAVFDKSVHFDATSVSPFVTWGTNPGQGVALSQCVPDPAIFN